MTKSGEPEDLGKLREVLESKDKGFSAIRKRAEGRNKRFQEKEDNGEDISRINTPSYRSSPKRKAEDIYHAAQMEDSKDAHAQQILTRYDKQDFEEAVLYELQNIGDFSRKKVKNSSPEERHKIIGGLKNEIEKTEKILSDSEIQNYFNVSDEEMEGYKETFRRRAYEGAKNAVKASQKDSEYKDTRASENLINYIGSSEMISKEDKKTKSLENKVAGIFSLFAFGAGAVLSYSGITGNVISQSANASSGIGALLVVLGAIAGLYYFKK